MSSAQTKGKTMETKKSDIVKIQNIVKNWVEKNCPTCVKCTTGQGSIHLQASKRDKQHLQEAKKAMVDYILENFGHRKWVHARNNGYKTWWYYCGNQPEGLRTGVKVKMEEFELRSVLLGPGSWYGIQEK